MAPKKGDGLEGRKGVLFRKSKYVLEMRLSKKFAAALKLHLGPYETVEEAHVGRDYAAYLRNSTGQESFAAVGGFNPEVHSSIFKFQESPGVFESLEAQGGSRAHTRCVEYKSLLELSKEASKEVIKEACTNFCKAARKDIRVAIESFRSRFPQTFPRPPPSNRLPNTEPVDGEIHRTPPPSSSEVRVLPTPGREVGVSTGEGSSSFNGALSREVQISVNLSPFQTRLLTAEEISRIERAAKDEMEKIHRELIDKLLKDLDPCLIEPETIPALE